MNGMSKVPTMQPFKWKDCIDDCRWTDWTTWNTSSSWLYSSRRKGKNVKWTSWPLIGQFFCSQTISKLVAPRIIYFWSIWDLQKNFETSPNMFRIVVMVWLELYATLRSIPIEKFNKVRDRQRSLGSIDVGDRCLRPFVLAIGLRCW